MIIDSLNRLDPTKNRTADNPSALNHEKGITCICIGQIRSPHAWRPPNGPASSASDGEGSFVCDQAPGVIADEPVVTPVHLVGAGKKARSVPPGRVRVALRRSFEEVQGRARKKPVGS